MPELTWPPDPGLISSEAIKPPDILLKLIETILTASKNRASRSSSIGRLTNSIAEDIVFSCLKGEVLQPKHLFLGLGIHNLTGSRIVIDFLYRLGHCINYNNICDKLHKQKPLKRKRNQRLFCRINQIPQQPCLLIIGLIILT